MSFHFEEMMPMWGVLLQYLQSDSETHRTELIEEHSELFTPELLASLESAEVEMRETAREVRDVNASINCLANVLEIPSLTLTEGDESQHEQMKSLFIDFLKSMVPTAIPVANPPPLMSSIPPVQEREGTKAGAWYQQRNIVLPILSYLSASDILSNAEYVRSDWQYWLYHPEMSRFFWIGVVQREFSDFFRAIIESTPAAREDAATLTLDERVMGEDWRTIAMLCVTQEAGSL